MMDPLSYHFNPRAHEGHDFVYPNFVVFLRISIHVPTRGTTPCPFLEYVFLDISIHVPTRGTT